MKALFLGNVAADTANGIMAELPPGLRVEILADPQRLMQSPGAPLMPTYSSAITGARNTRRHPACGSCNRLPPALN
jgi:hypothetical protein